MKYLLLVFSIAFLASCGSDVEGLTPEEYISQNNLQATELDNGVYIVVHEQGNTVKPSLKDLVDVSYSGKLTDGTAFPGSDDFRTGLTNIIQGWVIGLSALGEGGSCTLIIPHEMGYGNTQNGPIPPKSTLVFDIDLKKVHVNLSVDEYISSNSLTTTELDEGVHIVVQNQGSEKRPSANSTVSANYTGILTSGVEFDSGENVTFSLAGVIEGWTIGLQEIGEGGSCTLIIPAEAGYGSSGAGIIPPNVPLVFDVELVKVD